MMRDFTAVLFGKFTLKVSQWLRLGAGSTWPGEIALNICPDILVQLFRQLNQGVIIVAGTNGKTTTSLMIKTILEHMGSSVIYNDSGANLLNGVVSAFIQKSNWLGKIEADWGVFEADENSLPAILSEIKIQNSSPPRRDPANTINQMRAGKFIIIVVLLNLFRDQLDRYGEVDVIAEKWEKALRYIDTGNQHIKNDQRMFILNADDPLVSHLGKELLSKKLYFGVNDARLYLTKKEHATDSTFCLNCGGRLNYDGIYYSHIGIWKCEKCGEKRPPPDVSVWKSSLPGLYNLYNTLAAVSVAKAIKIKDADITSALADFAPAFGRQEEFKLNGKNVKIFLSKNPAGFNEALKTVIELGAKELLLVLNDRIADGRDVSWIWDVDFEMLPAWITPVVSGDRAHDLALRLKYARPVHILPVGAVSEPVTPIIVYEDLQVALTFCLGSPNKHETLYILPTYSAMLKVRKILKGRKIL